MGQNLPSYKSPPVIEVVSGLRFHTPENFKVTHIGLLWDKFREEYPVIQHAAPIVTPSSQLVIDAATGSPLPRVWFINKEDNHLIQFQVDRFYFNWRQRNDIYPRYSNVITKFENLMNAVDSFFKDMELGDLRPIEFELNYINHIPKGQGWNTIDDLPKVFSDLLWRKRKGRFLPKPANLAWQVDFLLPDNKGHLTVKLNQAVRLDDKLPVLVLELTARGIGEPTSKDAIRGWFDTAHEWIVCGFTDLTTLEIQTSFWGREDA